MSGTGSFATGGSVVDLMHWATKYIGIPYEAGSRGPATVDCWGLVRMAYQQQFGIEMPLHPGISLEKPKEASIAIQAGLQSDWRSIENPVDGCLVAMSHRISIHHIGLYAAVENGRILHCSNGQNVVADTLRGLRMRGMRLIKFYLHNQWPT